MERTSTTESVEIQKGRSIFLVMELTRTRDGLSLYLKSEAIGKHIEELSASRGLSPRFGDGRDAKDYGRERKGYPVEIAWTNQREAGTYVRNLGWGSLPLFYDGDQKQPNIAFFFGEGLAEGYRLRINYPATRAECEKWIRVVKDSAKSFFRSNLSPFKVRCELVENGEES